MSQDTPNIIRGHQTDYKKLFYSNPEAALRIPVTLKSGYGIIPMGTLLARVLNGAAAGVGELGKYVPYNPTDMTGNVPQAGRAYILADSGTAVLVYVTQDDSYRFKVGDDIIINDSDTTAVNLGAITAIDRTTERQRAKITFTTSTGADFATADSAYIACEAGANTDFSTADGVLEKDVDTGVGENAKGAIASMLVSNALIYHGACENADTAGIADIGAQLAKYIKIS